MEAHQWDIRGPREGLNWVSAERCGCHPERQRGTFYQVIVAGWVSATRNGGTQSALNTQKTQKTLFLFCEIWAL